MNSLDMVHAIEAWVADALPGVQRFDHPPAELGEVLPVVVAEIATDIQQDADTQLPGVAQYQQTLIRSWAVDVIIMVHPEPPDEASHALYGYVDTLAAALARFVRLDTGVVLSQYYSASYDPPEVVFADGTKVRLVTIRVTAGETIGAQ